MNASAVTQPLFTFNDLSFVSRDNRNFSQAYVVFPNGYEVSVLIGEDGVYSNGIDTYEFAVRLKGKLVLINEIGDEVIGYINAEEVTRLMQIVQQLPKQA